MNPTSVTSAALPGDYETADRMAAEQLGLNGTTQVMEREKTPSARPRIERVAAVDRRTDGRHRVWLDGDSGVLRADRPGVAGPPTGCESAERSSEEERNILERR